MKVSAKSKVKLKDVPDDKSVHIQPGAISITLKDKGQAADKKSSGKSKKRKKRG